MNNVMASAAMKNVSVAATLGGA